MFGTIRADVLRLHRSGSPLRWHKLIHLLLKNYGLQAVVVYRFGQWIKGLRHYPLGFVAALPLQCVYRLLDWYIRKAYGISLAPSSHLGAGFYVGHFGGIRVENAVFGRNCAIQQHAQLTAVAPAEPGPRIGDDVWIGAHAKVMGNISIGDGATIGAGAVVLQDVPARCLMLGNPARIAQRDYDNSGFL